MADFKKQNKEFESKMDDTKIMQDENGEQVAVGNTPLKNDAVKNILLEQMSREYSNTGDAYDRLKDASRISAPFATMMKSPTFNEMASGVKPYAVGEVIQKAFTQPASIDVEKQKEGYKNLLERYKAVGDKNKTSSSIEEGLRKELAPHLKRFSDIDIAYNKILKAVSKPSAANDVTLVYNFMKMQDPGSTVREGEYATAANAAGIPDKVRAMYNKAIRGETLAPTQRADFASAAKGTYSAEKETYDMIASGYKKVADRTGADWANIDIFSSNRAKSQPNVKDTVTVSNGKETLIIPAEDLSAAKKDGYNEVK
jgi:hypothetical protein